MNKKLMAVAVAGALAAPAMAFAQASTVQIYGLLNAEYGFVNQPDTAAGASRHNADGLRSGASRIGFKGEEKLGSGMSAWFQCESDIRFLAGSSTTSAAAGSWCDRNSAIGLKGGFGNFFIGTWDTPIKQAVAATRMLNETGYLGAQHILLSGAIFDGSKRVSQSINYVTPNMGGFTARAQLTSTNAAFDKLSTDGRVKGRVLGLGADYKNGPLVVAAGWEKADDNRSAAYGNAGAKDTAWAIGATYAFGPAKVGLTYTDQKAEEGGTNFEVKRKSWNLALDWQVTAAGLVRVGYTQAGDYKGNDGAPNTGAKQWQVGYNHSLSKRTTAGIAYVKLDNDSAGFYNLTGFTSLSSAGAAQVSGDNASAIVFSLQHTF